MDRKLFCSALSQDRSERIFGTAPLVDRWILIEDRGSWNKPALPDRNLPAQVLERLQDTAAAHERTRPLLIRQGHSATGPLRCFIAETRETGSRLRRILFDQYDELLHLDLETGGEIVDEPLILVCTHGRHDKCCARFGIPAYRRVRCAFPSNTWECTHVGGDRFAANLLCLPHGLYYGHLSPEEAVAAAEGYGRGTLLIERYRGRSCYPKIAQIGEFFVRSAHGLAHLDGLCLRDMERLPGNRWQVRFDSAGELLTAEFEHDPITQAGFLTCHATEVKTIRQYRLTTHFETR